MFGYSASTHSPNDMEGCPSWSGLQHRESYNLLFGSYNLTVPVVTGGGKTPCGAYSEEINPVQKEVWPLSWPPER